MVTDPCMGSGHILVYAFDVLMQIYESYGYGQRDAAKSIVENNIYGLDIDDRAFQLAYFAITMKARSYNRRFLTLEIEPNLCAIQESNGLQYDDDMGDFLLSEEHRETLKYLLHTFVDAKEYGSILNVEKRDYDGFLEAWKLTAEASLGNVVMMLWYNECNQVVPVLAKQAKVLSEKYDIAMTNPPYMSNSGMGKKMSDYIKKYYPDSKADLFAVFIEKCDALIKSNGFRSMITQHTWMFLSSFEKFRGNILRTDIVNMLHLGARAFEEISGEVVQTVSFVTRKKEVDKYNASYVQLTGCNTSGLKERVYLRGNNRYIMSKDKFALIPSCTLAYWISDKYLRAFADARALEMIAVPKSGLSTTDNNRFLRMWFEPSIEKINFKQKNGVPTQRKFFPYSKGGEFRRWYGNLLFVVNWENDGADIKQAAIGASGGRVVNPDLYFKEYITWTKISTGLFSMRYFPEGTIFSDAGGSLLCKDNDKLIAFLNTKVCQSFLNIINQTLNYVVGNVAKLPVYDIPDECTEIALECIEIAKEDWDSFECSWDFKRHPLVGNFSRIEEAYNQWKEKCSGRFAKIKSLEEKLNLIFIELYGLEDELSPEIDDNNITIRLAGKERDIRSLLSYAVGCIVGRYSLDVDGVAYAGGVWDNTKYISFQPDRDNVIPITDEEYYADDIVGLFCEWMKAVYGENTLEENLTYIANALNVKGSGTREIIRNYFLQDFFKEHCVDYSTTGSGKRPIYWLFDSGKQNGFKALVYMHRYNADTIGNLRVDYLHRMERIYESEINRMQDTIDNSSNAREVTAATKRKEKLQKQLKECQEYDEKIGHLALSRIDIDLDDGVKVNYEKVQTANDGKKYQVLAKI